MKLMNYLTTISTWSTIRLQKEGIRLAFFIILNRLLYGNKSLYRIQEKTMRFGGDVNSYMRRLTLKLIFHSLDDSTTQLCTNRSVR